MKAAAKLHVVFDTNVLLSMLGFPGGHLDGLWELTQSAKFELYLSEFILEELTKNLRLKTRLNPRDISITINILRYRAHVLRPAKHLQVIKRKDSDNRILECAAAARASVLVTGDLQDLRPLGHFQGI